MSVNAETEEQRNQRVLAWAATAPPARSDDRPVIAGHRLNIEDLRSYLAQQADDRAQGITDRDWNAWVTQLHHPST